MVLNMQKVLSRHDGIRDLGGLVGKYLYIAVLVQEDTGTTLPTMSHKEELAIEKLSCAQVESARKQSLLLSSLSTHPTH